jgi:hypothetical protein
MKINQKQLRQIIRDEMLRETYAGMLAPVSSKLDRYSPQQTPLGQDAKFDREPALRWVTSGRFDDLAQRYYANLPFNVWLAPFVGALRSLSDDPYHPFVDNPEAVAAGFELGGLRLGSVDLATGIRNLGAMGYSGTENISPNDLVILFNASTTKKRLLSTPWTIIHCIFDSAGGARKFCPSWSIIEGLFNYETDDPDFEILCGEQIEQPEWLPALTMGSARSGEIMNTVDAWAEICTQDLLTRRGVTFDYDAVTDEEAQALRKFTSVIKQISSEFRANVPGNLIYVDVS